MPELEYPDHFDVCRTYPNGVISWRGSQCCLKNELVGLEEVDNDRWRVFFGTILLGILDVRRTRELRNTRN
ncbi:MAG: hypothetical protein M3020_26350 [Myxococcota bacterium]|nr:hypothetical protein [Myxococcota bacterium]